MVRGKPCPNCLSECRESITILGGGLLSTEIEIILDGSIENPRTLMTVRNFDTAFENNSIAIARLSIEGIDSTLEGKVILSLLQENKMTIMDLNGRLFVAPGHCLLVRLMNRTRRTNFVSLDLSWWE